MSDDLESHFLALYEHIAELRRRLDGMVTQGPITEVDPDAGTVRVRVGGTDEEPMLSGPIPYAQSMGAFKGHSPPSVGQQMKIINVAGDYAQGLAIPMTQSDQNKSPSKKGDEHVATFGNYRQEIRAEDMLLKVPKFRVECGGSTLEMTGDGITIQTPKGTFKIDEFLAEGSSLKHNSKEIGSTHEHTGVVPGNGFTGPPK
jgi:phage baseplate assembly protein gpV